MDIVDRNLLNRWIDHCFDHPVEEEEWYWGEDAEAWAEPSAVTARLIAEAFENSEELLVRFTDEQLNQGFWYVLGVGSGMMWAVKEAGTPTELQVRVVRSFVPLFGQVMASRCSNTLGHLDERKAKPLNSACYMWWDMDTLSCDPSNPEHAAFAAAALSAMRDILSIPHDACRESALHGLGHWACSHPEAARIVDEFLANSQGLRKELLEYAEAAREGGVL